MGLDQAEAASLREQRLDEILGVYLVDLDRGVAPDRSRLMASYPDLSTELAEFFASLDELSDLPNGLRHADAANLPAPSPAPNLTSLSVVSPEDFPSDGETETLAFLEVESSDLTPYLGPGMTEPGLSADLSPGPMLRRFGDFVILEQIGHGGMGFVFKARHIHLKRMVALKLLAGGALAAAEDVEQFWKEAQAAARLDHPNIVPIHDVGVHERQHYFSMKLIEPGDLQANASAFASDRKAAARLVATVARAVHYAHQHGVLHRDLKPSNILVDQAGVPHVTDFGLAKIVDAQPEAASLAGEPVGTPAYMAPEQARGDRRQITTATDVYGLGAILYTLLAGHPPYHDQSRQCVLEQARSGAPIVAPPVRRRADRDLNTICLKCLEKAPERRYGSAKELAEDLDRWLANEPILARPVNWAERTWRWCRRNRLIAAALAVVGMAFFLSAGVLAFASVITLTAKNRAEEAQRLADTRFVQARRAVDEMYTEVAERWLANQPRLKAVQLQFLRRARDAYEEFLRTAARDAHIALETAKAHRRLGEIELLLGESRNAEESLKTAVRLLTELAREHPARTGVRLELGDAYLRLGSLEDGMENNPQAMLWLRKASTVLQDLVDSHSESHAARRSLARSWCSIAHLELKTGSIDPAERAYRTALRHYSALVEVATTRNDFQSEMAGVLNDLAQLLQQRGDLQTAREMLMQALARQTNVVEREPEVPSYRYAQGKHAIGLAGLNVLLGDYTAGEHSFRQAIGILTSLVHDFASVPGFRRSLALGHSAYASLLALTGRLDEAERELNQGLSLMGPLLAEYPHLPGYEYDVAHICLSLGQVRISIGRLSEAEAVIRQAVELSESASARAPDSVEFRSSAALTNLMLGSFLASRGRAAEGEPYLRKGAASAQTLAAKLPELPGVQGLDSFGHSTLASLLQQTHRALDAENVYRQGIEADRSLSKSAPGHFEHRHNLARDLVGLASLLKTSHRYSEASPLYEEALHVQQGLVNDSSIVPHFQRDLATTLIELAELERLTGNFEPAEKYAWEGESLFRRLVSSPGAIPDDRRSWAESLNVQGRLEQETKSLEEAERSYRRAREIYNSLVVGMPDRPDYESGLAATLDHLAGVLPIPQGLPESRELLEEALKHERKALESNPNDPSFILYFSIHSANLAKVLLQLGEHSTAVKQLQELESMLPTSAVAHAFSASLLGACPLRAARDLRLPQTTRIKAARAYQDLAEHAIERALALRPEQAPAPNDGDTVRDNIAQGLNSLAWYHAMCPDRSLRDPERAATLGRRAVDLAPDSGTFWSTLATAQYYRGHWQEAIDNVQQALKRPHHGEVYDWTLLAAAHAQLGHAVEARSWYALATARLESKTNEDDALRELRAEAETAIAHAGRAAVPTNPAPTPENQELRGEPSKEPMPESFP